jgi:hypothetical protein
VPGLVEGGEENNDRRVSRQVVISEIGAGGKAGNSGALCIRRRVAIRCFMKNRKHKIQEGKTEIVGQNMS